MLRVFKGYSRNAGCIRTSGLIHPSGPTRLQRFVRSLSTTEYHELADDTLEAITEGYESLIEEKPEIDVDLAQGVITLQLPPIGTYVINKQPPNQQIWLSSPISGPKRYDWDEKAQKWVYDRDQSSLGELLKRETLDVTKLELQLANVD